MGVEVNYFFSETNKSPVKDFVDSLDIRTQTKFFAKKKLLEDYGRSLPYPHAKHIDDGIFELRFVGIEGNIRALYFFFHSNNVILTNGFVKKTRRTPKREITTAKLRRKTYIEIIKTRGIK